MRRCIACYGSFPQDGLIRFILVDGVVIPDGDAKQEGRGVYLCRNEECLKQAVKKKAFSRAFRKNVDIDTNYEAIEKIINSTKEE